MIRFAPWGQNCLTASPRQQGLTPPSAVCKLISGGPGDTGPGCDVITTCSCYWAQLHVTWGQAVFHATETLAIMLLERQVSCPPCSTLTHPSFWNYLIFHTLFLSVTDRSCTFRFDFSVTSSTWSTGRCSTGHSHGSFNVLNGKTKMASWKWAGHD